MRVVGRRGDETDKKISAPTLTRKKYRRKKYIKMKGMHDINILMYKK